MSEKRNGSAPPPQVGVHTMMPAALVSTLDYLRAQIQESIGSRKVITRADIVRLAVRRLQMAHILWLLEQPNPPLGIDLAWAGLVKDMQAEGTCPAWLMPGQMEEHLPSKSKSKRTPVIRDKKGE